MNISLTSLSVKLNFRAENNARPKVLHRPRLGLPGWGYIFMCMQAQRIWLPLAVLVRNRVFIQIGYVL